jgi:hypothetical protein
MEKHYHCGDSKDLGEFSARSRRKTNTLSSLPSFSIPAGNAGRGRFPTHSLWAFFGFVFQPATQCAVVLLVTPIPSCRFETRIRSGGPDQQLHDSLPLYPAAPCPLVLSAYTGKIMLVSCSIARLLMAHTFHLTYGDLMGLESSYRSRSEEGWQE